MAENCRKLFPSATRQRRSCLEAIIVPTFVLNSHSLLLSQPVTTVAASVFVLRTPSAPSNAIYVPLENNDTNDEQRICTLKKLSDWLLTGCFCLSVQQNIFQPWKCSSQNSERIRTMSHQGFSPKHSSDVSVSLIKAFLGNSLRKIHVISPQKSNKQCLLLATWIKGEPWKSILSLL